MTLIERARSRRPITWLTIIGVLLLPVVIGGLLVAALQNPTQNLDRMTAAIVNLDEPVTINDQYTPLGRELASGLVEGSDEVDSNLTWVISNKDDAADGLSDGTYQAVVTIPKDFSKNATSGGQAIADGGGSAQQAQIQVTTPQDARVADDLITSQIANVAASSMGSMLSEATLSNVLIGFDTLGSKIGEAADGADKLADGAQDAADGAAALPDGATKLADGANQLSSGASQLGDGAGQVAAGASQLGSGLDTLADKTREAGAGASQIGSGLTNGAAALEKNGIVPDPITDLAGKSAAAGAGVAAGVSEVSAGIDGLVKLCADYPTDDKVCAGLKQLQSKMPALTTGANGAKDAAAGTAYALGQFDTAGAKEIAKQLADAGTGAASLASGLGQIAGGIDLSADGARGLSTGASKIATGNRGLATGAAQLGDGATQLADGTTQLGTGLDQLAGGTSDLADGLHTAASSLPSFSEKESTSLASVVANPVKSDVATSSLFGATAIPLLVALVLWFGSLASYVVMRAMPERVLTSRRSSIALALRGFWPAALIGAAQGLLVSLIVQMVASYDAAHWWSFAGIAVLAGVSFAAVNQALVALFGGIGRWIGVLVGVLAVATGLVSTVPGWLASVGAAMPTAPALSGLIDASGTAVAGLIVWGVLALLATTLSVTLRRTTSAKAVLATAAA
ncbi:MULTISPECIES: YhgE/Pip family protein [unclassified Microbacterium]|uniref:YhgE/Pip family protein n=1 Tax=unclassified Microbacterium TaxID=2609290 RepID=UPI0012FB7BAD|nr:YhgE/Pip family protein [Microbacterium sp. MAH-37]MVQ42717.1 ABC transporter permease [Microbacterium sp. MAH-37]